MKVIMNLFKLFRRNDPVTSLEAAESVIPDLPNIQGQVYAYAKMRGSEGFTDDQLNKYFRTTKSTYRSRRATLVEKGYIVDSGIRVKNEGGRFTILWRAL
jgi:hypothetical protein